MRTSTALTCTVVLGVACVLAILIGVPDLVMALLLGAFGLAAFLSLTSDMGDALDVESGFGESE